MLISPDEIGKHLKRIDPSDFYIPGHRTIYKMLVNLWQARQPIDLINFSDALRNQGLLDHVGGTVFVTSLFTFVPTPANLLHYLNILHEKRALREVTAAFDSLYDGGQRAFKQKHKHRSLTAREATVLHELRHGRTNKEIAALLKITVSAVAKHVEHIFAKLRLESGAAALTTKGKRRVDTLIRAD